MTGAEALAAYGFELKDGRHGHPNPKKRTQSYEPTEGGFHRYEADGSQQPYRVKDEFGSIGGLDPANAAHAAMYEWVWPDDEIARIYSHAAEQAAAGWPDRNDA